MRRRVSRGTLGVICANVVALTALVFATGGASWAAALVGTNRLADGAVTTAKIRDGAVTSGKIAAGSVGTSRLAANAVTSGKIRAASVTSTKLASGAVTRRSIGLGQVDRAAIGNGAVGSAEIADRTVENRDLQDRSVGRAKLTKRLLATKWSNADKLDGVDLVDIVRKTQHAAVIGERSFEIEIPQGASGSEQSIVRMDSTNVKGDMLIIARLNLDYPPAQDARGLVRCRLRFNGTTSGELAVVGFQKFASDNVLVGGNQVVLTDRFDFPTTGRNTIDVRCSTTLDSVLAKDMSIIGMRISSLDTVPVT